MNRRDDRFLRKPTTVDEFMRCLIWDDWDPFVAFDEGSKYCLNIAPQLIRDSVEALRKRTDLSRYTFALTKIVTTSDNDAQLTIAWRTNLRQLRALLYTSAVGTPRQRAKLLEIALNKQVVEAMRYALRHEHEIESKTIEPSWIAVLFAEGSDASVEEANRYYVHLKEDRWAALLGYRGKCQEPNQTIEPTR